MYEKPAALVQRVNGGWLEQPHWASPCRTKRGPARAWRSRGIQATGCSPSSRKRVYSESPKNVACSEQHPPGGVEVSQGQDAEGGQHWEVELGQRDARRCSHHVCQVCNRLPCRAAREGAAWHELGVARMARAQVLTNECTELVLLRRQAWPASDQKPSPLAVTSARLFCLAKVR